jgi:hypothetical protein
LNPQQLAPPNVGGGTLIFSPAVLTQLKSLRYLRIALSGTDEKWRVDRRQSNGRKVSVGADQLRVLPEFVVAASKAQVLEVHGDCGELIAWFHEQVANEKAPAVQKSPKKSEDRPKQATKGEKRKRQTEDSEAEPSRKVRRSARTKK